MDRPDRGRRDGHDHLLGHRRRPRHRRRHLDQRRRRPDRIELRRGLDGPGVFDDGRNLLTGDRQDGVGADTAHARVGRRLHDHRDQPGHRRVHGRDDHRRPHRRPRRRDVQRRRTVELRPAADVHDPDAHLDRRRRRRTDRHDHLRRDGEHPRRRRPHADQRRGRAGRLELRCRRAVRRPDASRRRAGHRQDLGRARWPVGGRRHDRDVHDRRHQQRRRGLSRRDRHRRPDTGARRRHVRQRRRRVQHRSAGVRQPDAVVDGGCAGGRRW